MRASIVRTYASRAATTRALRTEDLQDDAFRELNEHSRAL